MKYYLFLLLFLSQAFGQDFTLDKDSGKAVPNYLGQLKLVKGQVYKDVNGNLEEVKVGTRFYKKDTVVTADKSFARIEVVDDTLISIGPKSELNFADFKFKDKKDRSIVYKLIKGQVSGDVKQKAAEGKIFFKTSYATMGVRGTKVLVNHRNVKNLEISEFALLSGSAMVTDLAQKEYELNKGQRVVIAHDPVLKKGVTESLLLSAPEFKTLEAKEIDEEKSFKPLLPYFEPSEAPAGSAIPPLLEVAKATSSASSTPSGSKRTKNKNWRKSLKELNEQLKKNQQDSP